MSVVKQESITEEMIDKHVEKFIDRLDILFHIHYPKRLADKLYWTARYDQIIRWYARDELEAEEENLQNDLSREKSE